MGAVNSSPTPSPTPWTKWPPIWQTTFSNEFSWLKMIESQFKFHWYLFPGAQLTISQHWLGRWLCAKQATSHYLNQWWSSLSTHVCVTRGRWVKPLQAAGFGSSAAVCVEFQTAHRNKAEFSLIHIKSFHWEAHDQSVIYGTRHIVESGLIKFCSSWTVTWKPAVCDDNLQGLLY